MNRKMIFYMLGRIVQLEAVLLLLPTVCSIIYRENKVLISFLVTIVISLVLGFLLTLFGKVKDKTIFAREGFAIVALAWIVMSAIGALPFYLSQEIPSYTNAFFETVSGFTTTGASILTDVESMSYGLLFWRSFTHWIGGMGVLVLVMAILPSDSGRSIHIMRAEMPGPIIGKLVPKIRSTAKILYLIYIALTTIEIIFLLFGGMNLFDSIVHSFGTAGTGGFGIKADSIGGYSPYLQWVITIFMLIFGINFNLYYLILLGKIKTALKSEELWTYIGIVLAATAIITANIYNTAQNFATVSDSVRHSMFQVSTIITTTGYATTDFNMWPGLSKMVLFLIMFVGGCAGSTAGGFKLSRVILLFKQIKTNLKHMLHSRSVESVKFEGKTIDNTTVYSVTGYLAIYVFCLVIIVFVLSFDCFNFETNISAAVSCFNNVGPGFDVVGPSGNYSAYSLVSRWTLSAAMLLGRLEIYPMILLFSPSVWVKNRKK